MHIAQEMKSLLSKPPYLKRVHYQFRRGLHFWIFSLPALGWMLKKIISQVLNNDLEIATVAPFQFI